VLFALYGMTHNRNEQAEETITVNAARDGVWHRVAIRVLGDPAHRGVLVTSGQ
jgi:hypothetical protein